VPLALRVQLELTVLLVQPALQVLKVIKDHRV